MPSHWLLVHLQQYFDDHRHRAGHESPDRRDPLAIIPLDPVIRLQLLNALLLVLDDTRDSLELSSDGNYTRLAAHAQEKPVAAQDRFMRIAIREAAKAERVKPARR